MSLYAPPTQSAKIKNCNNFNLGCISPCKLDKPNFYTELGTKHVLHLIQQQALIPNFWGRLRILNKLLRVGHMYSFSPFDSI